MDCRIVILQMLSLWFTGGVALILFLSYASDQNRVKITKSQGSETSLSHCSNSFSH